MLVGALSGFRSFRTPLVVGYVVLLAAWLFLYPHLPHDHHALRADYPEVSRIAQIVGTAGIVAISALLAYAVGVAVVRVASRLLPVNAPPVESSRSQARQFLRGIYSWTQDAETNFLESRLDAISERRLGRLSEEDRSEIRAELSVERGQSLKSFRVLLQRIQPTINDAGPPRLSMEERIRDEVKSGRIDDRILAVNPELWSESNRLRSEAEFLAGLAPALGLLLAALLARTSWGPVVVVVSVGFCLLLLFTLVNEMFDLRSRSRGIATRAVIDGIVSTPTLDELTERIEERTSSHVARVGRV